MEGEKQSAPASPAREEDASSPEVADQVPDETVATDVDDDHLFKDEPDDDEYIRYLNEMGRMKLLTPEFIQELKENHHEYLVLPKNFYEICSKDQEAHDAAADGAAGGQSSSP